MRRWRAGVTARDCVRVWFTLLSCGLGPAAYAASWAVEAAPASATAQSPWAVVTNDAGDRLALFNDDAAQVHLQFTAGGAFSGLSRSSCPTFQIDARTPLHHFAIDDGCRIELASAVLDVGQLRGRTLTSIVVHRLMNGDKVSVRYMTADGAYHEANFSLSHSADAIRGALGRAVRVSAE